MTGSTLLTFGYTPENQLASATDSMTGVTTINRGTAGPSGVIGPYGHRTSITPDSAGRLRLISDPVGRTHTFEFTAGDLVDYMDDPRSGRHDYTYDPITGQLSADANPNAEAQTFVPGQFVQDMDGDPMTDDSIEFDGTRHTTAGGRETLYLRRYSGTTGASRRVVDSNDLPIDLGVSAGRRVVTRPDGTVLRQDPAADPRFEMAAPRAGTIITEIPYSGLTEPLTSTIQLSHDGLVPDPVAGDVTWMSTTVDTNGRVSTRRFDDLGGGTHQLEVTTPGGRYSRTQTNIYDQPTDAAVYDGDPDAGGTIAHRASFQYDGQYRLDLVTQHGLAGELDRTIDYEYGADGLLRWVGDGAGGRSVFDYDGAGWLHRIHDGESRITRYERNDNGSLTELHRPASAAHHAMSYDGAERLTSWTTPDGHTTTYTYDADGRPKTVSQPVGRLRYLYEGEGVSFAGRRLERIQRIADGTDPTLPGASVVEDAQLAYDTEGRLDWVESFQGHIEDYSFDGPLLRSVDTGSRVVSYDYDSSVRLEGEQLSVGSHESGVRLSYADQDDLVTSACVCADAACVAATDPCDPMAYLAAAQVTVVPSPVTGFRDEVLVFAGGSDVTSVVGPADRNSFGEVEREVTTRGGATIYSHELDYDVVGRITRQRTVLPATSGAEDYGFEYDRSGKLTEWTSRPSPMATPVQRGSYTYDTAGHRELTVDDRGSLTATYNGDDQLLQLNDAAAAETYYTATYDDDGYIASRAIDLPGTSSDQALTFEHDPLGQLRRVTIAGGPVIDYGYDFHGRRVSRTVDGVLERQWVFGSALGPIAELDGAGIVQKRFIYVTHTHTPDLMIEGGTVYRFIKDIRGSVRAVVNVATGAVVQKMAYDPWGRVLAGESTDEGFQPFGMGGGLIDPDTGLLRLGVRDYDPVAGRFVQPDPLGFDGGQDLYSYGDDDPANFIDPSGRIAGLVFELGFAVGCALMNGRINSFGDLFMVAGNALAWGVLGTALGAIAVAAKVGRATGTYSQLRRAGAKDAHHIIQDAAVRDIAGYSRSAAPSVQLRGPARVRGTPHHTATQVQRQAGGGTYAAERRIAYKALRKAGVPPAEARQLIGTADQYFGSLGVGPSTPTRYPGNRTGRR